MHEKDRKKLLDAGFNLYRCSEIERVVKKRTAKDLSWHVIYWAKTKKHIRNKRAFLLGVPNAIQD